MIAVSDNLPLPRTSFVGRKRELAGLKSLLYSKARVGENSQRLVTVVGAGGIGKTRLAVQVASRLKHHFPHGVWFVDLAALTDPSWLLKRLVQTFEIKEDPEQSLIIVLINYLRKRHMLVILDNCEHLLSACAELCGQLLQACPGLIILTTSREVLNLPNELAFSLSSLSLPDSSQIITLQQLKQSEAVQLFYQRAKLIEPDFSLTEANAATIVQIVQRLDGMPLAIELAVARLNLLSPVQLAQRLDDSFNLLTGGHRSALPRHQTLRGVFDWSYAMLEKPTQILFERLSIFNNGWTLEAAEAICRDAILEQSQILEELGQLVAKSLVVVVEQPDHLPKRYRFLETIRQYATEKLEAARLSELSRLQERYTHWYLTLVEEIEPTLSGAEQINSAQILNADLANLRKALSLLSATPDSTKLEKAVRLATAAHSFWLLGGEGAEGRSWLQNTLALTDQFNCQIAPLVEINALNALALLENLLFNHKQTEVLLRKSLSLSRPHYYKRETNLALSLLGFILILEENYAEAKSVLEESLVLSQELDDKNTLAFTLRSLAQLMELDQNFTQSHLLRLQAVKLYRETGNKRFLASLLNEFIRLAILENMDTVIPPAERSQLAQLITLTRSQLSEETFNNNWAEGRSLMLEQTIKEVRLVQMPQEKSSNPEILATASNHPVFTKPPNGLTRRELEVLQLLAQGFTNRQIAAQLVLSNKTISTHLEAIFHKLDVSSRSAATRFAIENKLI